MKLSRVCHKLVKEIWSQKEMTEVSLSQLDSFSQFADQTHKCTTDASYAATATQSIKLMEQLKDARGGDSALDYKIVLLGLQCSEGPLHGPLDKVFALGQPLSLKLSPAPGPVLVDNETATISVSLMVEVFS